MAARLTTFLRMDTLTCLFPSYVDSAIHGHRRLCASSNSPLLEQPTIRLSGTTADHANVGEPVPGSGDEFSLLALSRAFPERWEALGTLGASFEFLLPLRPDEGHGSSISRTLRLPIVNVDSAAH